MTRAQSMSHYNRPTLVSPLLAFLRHLRNSIPMLANLMITSWFPIDIAMLPDLARDSSDYISGLTVPTDVTLPFCPPSLLLLYSPDLFLMEFHLSRVQCSVSLVVPKFRTLSPFDHLPFPTFGYHSPSVFTFTPLSYSLFLFAMFPSCSDLCSTYSSS